MRKTLALAIAFLFVLCTLALAAELPKDVKIDAAAKKQAAVTFPHAKHVALGKACDTCHHTNKGMTKDNATKVEKCSTCHLDPKDAKVPSMREMNMTKNPFHALCVDCHKKGAKGPTSCTACHKK